MLRNIMSNSLFRHDLRIRFYQKQMIFDFRNIFSLSIFNFMRPFIIISLNLLNKMDENRNHDRFSQIKSIYKAYKVTAVTSLRPKAKSPILLYREKQINIFRKANIKQKVKQHLDESIIRSSKAYRDLELQMLMATRKHWFQIDKLKQTNNARIKQIDKQKRENLQKTMQVQEISARIGSLEESIGYEQQQYYYMTNQGQQNEQGNVEQNVEEEQKNQNGKLQCNVDYDEQSGKNLEQNLQ